MTVLRSMLIIRRCDRIAAAVARVVTSNKSQITAESSSARSGRANFCMIAVLAGCPVCALLAALFLFLQQNLVTTSAPVAHGKFLAADLWFGINVAADFIDQSRAQIIALTPD